MSDTRLDVVFVVLGVAALFIQGPAVAWWLRWRVRQRDASSSTVDIPVRLRGMPEYYAWMWRPLRFDPSTSTWWTGLWRRPVDIRPVELGDVAPAEADDWLGTFPLGACVVTGRDPQGTWPAGDGYIDCGDLQPGGHLTVPAMGWPQHGTTFDRSIAWAPFGLGVTFALTPLLVLGLRRPVRQRLLASAQT